MTLKYYSASYVGDTSGFGHTYPYLSIDDFRRELIRRHHWSKKERIEIYATYNQTFDKNGELFSFNRRPLGILNITEDTKGHVKVSWKSKATGKTSKVNPSTGRLIARRM